MQSNLKRWYGVIAVVSIVIGLMAGSVSRVYAVSPNPGIIPPNVTYEGLTYAEWSATWWQWAFSLPVGQNPFFDEKNPPSDKVGCSNGANGQAGPVWFLTGVINASGKAVRDCTVPAEKALFFPIINVECSSLEAPPFYGPNEEKLRACVEVFKFEKVSATIDGVAVEDLHQYLVESPLFNFTVPPDNVLGVPPAPGKGRSVANGYYLMLAPLSVGKHVIKFGGTFPDFGFTLDITYNLTVAPGTS